MKDKGLNCKTTKMTEKKQWRMVMRLDDFETFRKFAVKQDRSVASLMRFATLKYIKENEELLS